MKFLKIGLLLFFVINIYSSFIVNLEGYSKFGKGNYNDKLNSFGELIVKNIHYLDNVSVPFDQVFKYQARYAGTDRGYSFFSPNVSHSSLNILFKADGQLLEMPLDSPESLLKFKTALYHFESSFKKKDFRDDILKSLAKWHFSQMPNLHEIEVYFDLYQYQDLKDMPKKIKNKRILAFTLTRSKQSEK